MDEEIPRVACDRGLRPPYVGRAGKGAKHQRIINLELEEVLKEWRARFYRARFAPAPPQERRQKSAIPYSNGGGHLHLCGDGRVSSSSSFLAPR